MKLSVTIRIKDKATFGSLSGMAQVMTHAERSLYRLMLVDPEYAAYKPSSTANCMVLPLASSTRCACRSKGG